MHTTTRQTKELKDFSINRDKDDIIPLIKDAIRSEGANFKIFASITHQ